VKEGLNELEKTDDELQLIRLVSRGDDSRLMAVSMFNITRVLNPMAVIDAYYDPKKSDKPTVEFRQHEGTVDKDRVVNWIKTLGGVIR
jgi:hypothetical protein